MTKETQAQPGVTPSADSFVGEVQKLRVLQNIASSLERIAAALERAHPKPVALGDWYEWPLDERTSSGNYRPDIDPEALIVIKTPLGMSQPIHAREVDWKRSGQMGDVLAYALVIREN